MKCVILTLLNAQADWSKGVPGVNCMRQDCAQYDKASRQCYVLADLEIKRRIHEDLYFISEALQKDTISGTQSICIKH